MPLLSDKDRQFLQNHFSRTLVDPVRLVFFTQEVACQFCRETGQILDEVAGLSDKITVETYNFVTDKEVAERHGIDKIPATIVMGDTDHGIRFYGIPSGYEFTSLIEDIVDVSRGKTELSPETVRMLTEIEEPVHIQVFVTPTCPYCPSAVRLAHSLAIASGKVRADMVEAIEFPHLANRYSVYGVPRTVINEETHLEGAAPEPLFVAKVREALGLMTPDEVEQLMEEMLAQGQEIPEEPLEGEE
jgi:glutaredoxin-like protein